MGSGWYGLHDRIVEKQAPGSALFGFTPHYEVLPIRHVMESTPLRVLWEVLRNGEWALVQG